jgi:hypothetical protein
VSPLAFDVAELSAEEQAIVAMATVLGIANGGYPAKAAAVQSALGMHPDRFEMLVDGLYERALVWRTGDQLSNLDELETVWLSELAAQALGPAARPRKTDWAALRKIVFARVFEHTDPHCLYCRTHGVPLVLDHALPVSRGGSNHPANLLPACERCNTSKGAKTFAEYMAWRKARGL